MEEKSNASVNKRLYKLLIIILRYTPVVLSINDILHSILSYYNEQIVKHGKKLMHCLSELESKSGEHYMERYGKRRRGGMRDSDYDDEDYPRYY